MIVSGNSLEDVSLTCAQINQCTQVRGDKDIRKFLDGVYVTKKGHIVEDD